MEPAPANRKRRMEERQGAQEEGEENRLRCRLCRQPKEERPDVEQKKKKIKSYVVNRILKVSIDDSEIWYQVEWSGGSIGWIQEKNFIDDGVVLLDRFKEENKERIENLRLIIHEVKTHGTRTFLKGRSICKRCMKHDRKICFKDAHTNCFYLNCNCDGCKELDLNEKRAKKKMAMLGKRKGRKGKTRQTENQQIEQNPDDNDDEHNENEEPNEMEVDSEDDGENQREEGDDVGERDGRHQEQEETVENTVPRNQEASDEENKHSNTPSSTEEKPTPSQTPLVDQKEGSSNVNVVADSNEDDGLSLDTSYADFLESELFSNHLFGISVGAGDRVKHQLKNCGAMGDSLAFSAATVTGASSIPPSNAQENLPICSPPSVSKFVNKQQQTIHCSSDQPAGRTERDEGRRETMNRQENRQPYTEQNHDNSRSSSVSTPLLAGEKERKGVHNSVASAPSSLPSSQDHHESPSSSRASSAIVKSEDREEGVPKKRAKRNDLSTLLLHMFDLFGEPEKLAYELSALSEEEKSRILEASDVNQDTLLHLAIKMNRATIVKILLQHGASLNAKNSNEQTALQMAHGLAATEILQVLLLQGADYSNIISGLRGKSWGFLTSSDRKILKHDENLQLLLRQDRVVGMKSYKEVSLVTPPLCHRLSAGKEVSFNFKFFGEGREQGEWYLLCIHVASVNDEKKWEMRHDLKLEEALLNGIPLRKSKDTEMETYSCRPHRNDYVNDNVLSLRYEAPDRWNGCILIAQIIKVRKLSVEAPSTSDPSTSDPSTTSK